MGLLRAGRGQRRQRLRPALARRPGEGLREAQRIPDPPCELVDQRRIEDRILRLHRGADEGLMDLLAEQRKYYDARAGEYDEWWERKGRYDLGPEGNAAWKAEADHVRRILEARGIVGDVLE